MSAQPSVLLLRALGLGDFLAGVPAFRAVRRALPAHRVVLAAPPALAPLVPLTGAIDEHVPTGELEPVPWTGEPPDLAIDLHGNGPESRRLLEALGAGRVVGFSRPGDPSEPVWRDDEHERARWCRLLTEALGWPADPDDLLLAPPAAPSPVPGCVVVHPGAAYPSRRWPVERFAAVARDLATDHRVVVTGSAGERALAERTAAAAGLPADAVLAGRTDLASLAALVASAALVVCGDTGVAHLASAYGRPSVVLFGPTPPAWWGPPDRPEHVALWHVERHGDRRGDPWADEPDPRLLEITPAEVVDAARSLLDRAGMERSDAVVAAAADGRGT